MLKEIRKAASLLAEYARDERAAISPMMVFMLIPLCGIMALAGEVSFWFMTQRALQNAADSAALAAAANNDTTNTDTSTGGATHYRYQTEAYTVAKTYGFVDGANNIQVLPESGVPCPDGVNSDCYRVTILRNVPLYLTQMVGYGGDPEAASGDRLGKRVAAAAIARPRVTTSTYCLLALSRNTATGSVDSGRNSITCSGCANAEMSGCNVATNGNAVCNPANKLNADRVDTGGSNTCIMAGGTGSDSQPEIGVPNYEALAAQIPNLGCTGPNSPTISSDITFTSGVRTYCGNVTINGHVTASTPAGGGVIVIRDGNLNIPDRNGAVADSLTGSNLTIVFVGGANAASSGHTVTGDGTLNVQAPRSGDWSGVAIYQDPALRSGVNTTLQGNTTWNITGLVFMPYANFSINGIINKYGEYNCLALVTNSFVVGGNLRLFQNQSQCANAGLVPPSGSGATRQGLVQ